MERTGWGIEAGDTLRPLITTDDVDLLDDLMRLAAAAQTEPDVATSLSATRARWSGAPLVVIGADVVEAIAREHVPRRQGVIVVARDGTDSAVWRHAIEVGAEDVVEIPAGENSLVERFADMTDVGAEPAPVICVIGARGGAGATTVVGALAVAAARAGYCARAVDLDPCGSGLDVVLGSNGGQTEGGLDWSDVGFTRGRIPAAALTAGLPVFAGVGVLTWGMGPCESPWPGAAGAAIDALGRRSDLVVVDLPRALTDSASEAISRATYVLLVIPRDIRSVAGAARVVSSPLLDGSDLRLLVRGPAPGGISADDVGSALGVPILAEFGRDAGLDRDLEAGLPPGDSRRSHLARVSRRVLSELGDLKRVAV